MTSDIPTTTKSFETPTDILQTLDQAGIEFLKSTDSKVVVMWGTAVLMLEAESPLSGCSAVEIELVDPGNQRSPESDKNVLERFTDALTAAVAED